MRVPKYEEIMLNFIRSLNAAKRFILQPILQFLCTRLDREHLWSQDS